jgi:hypothetical protein
MTIEAASVTDETVKAALQKQIDAWRATTARYESDPQEKDGRKELRAQAEEYEHRRDTFLAKYHHYEVASAAYQIGIVLASATVITGIVVLSYIAIALGVAGLGFMAIAIFAPHAVHLF